MRFNRISIFILTIIMLGLVAIIHLQQKEMKTLLDNQLKQAKITGEIIKLMEMKK